MHEQPGYDPAAKPLSREFRAPLGGLAALTMARCRFRTALRALARAIAAASLRVHTSGLDNFPRRGPGLIVCNHLGDADVILMLAYSPEFLEPLAKVELRRIPILGWVMELYGVIWMRRSHADRGPLQAALKAFEEGRLVALAPEGRESLTGRLEKGLGGAAYLAIKAGVPLVPVVFTGTRNRRIWRHLARLQRPDVTMTVGPAFRVAAEGPLRSAVHRGTEKIMNQLARLLPPEYQGVYRQAAGRLDGHR